MQLLYSQKTWYTTPMKRHFLILISVLFLLCGGCARTDASASPTAESSPIVELLLADPTPSPTPMPTNTPIPDALNADSGQYTIAWISDTQYYSRKNNGVFECMTQFLRDNADRMRLAYIVHTGDLVHNRDVPEQWAVADRAMQVIDDLPNGVAAGNHDVGTKPEDCDYSYFSRYFGESRYAGKSWYGGSFEDNRGHFDLISTGNTEFLFVYLGYQVTQAGMDWARETFAAYPDRVGVLAVHDYFYHDLSLTEQGQLLYDNVVKPSKNLYLVMCGHRYNCACVPVELDDDGDGVPDRTVLQMIANYQAIGDAAAAERTGGDGYIHFLQVDDNADVIRYTSYSPYMDDYVYFDEPAHQMEKYAFSAEGEQGQVPIPWPH